MGLCGGWTWNGGELAERGGEGSCCGGSHCAAGQQSEASAWGGDGVRVGGGGAPALVEAQLGWHGFGLPEKQGQKTFALKNTLSHLQAGQKTLKTIQKSSKEREKQKIGIIPFELET